MDDAAVELLRAQGLRLTPQRLAIVQEALTAQGYIAPLEIIQRVQAKVPGTSGATVYRTLERLEQLGQLGRVHLESGLGYHRVTEPPHAHLTCVGCGAESELPPRTMRRMEREVKQVCGFRPDFTRHAISGLCAGCQAALGEGDG